MKKIFFGLLASIALSSQAQTADDIIQKYANAMGGLDNINKIKTVKMSGTVSAQGMKQHFGLGDPGESKGCESN